MKAGGGGEKSSSRLALRSLRFESQRFRLLSVVVVCFVISATFLLSSRPEATVVRTVPVSPRASLVDARAPTINTLRSSPGIGRDFVVDILPQQGEESHGQLQQSVDRSSEKTEWVNDTVIIEERNDGEKAETEEAERDHKAAARTGDSGDEAAPGTEEAVQDNAVQTTAAVITAQPAVETASSQPHRPDEEKKQVGGQIKLQGEPAVRQEQTPERKETAHSVDQHPLPPLCDFSDFRTNICDFTGDIRMDANSSAFLVVDLAAGGANGQSHKVRPYPRKGDETCMGRVTEITVRTTPDAVGAPRCTRTHAAPAVVFSIGGYTGNIFHDFSDVIVPLYNTVQRYRGDVQLVMANVASWWLVKYDTLLRELSRHAPLDLAKAGAAGEVHCFRQAVVSLRAHRELIIERERSLDGLATPDFTRFLRGALSLPRDAPTRLGHGTGRRPRLLIISRRRTRLLLNLDAVVRAAEEVGFEAVVNESDVANSIAQVGRLINSCDVLLGVHGAGLTNMMFLPPGATMVQVVPWGGLQWIARMDYGEPAEAMGLRYIQYEIGVGESSLKDKYPSGHEIFTNPTALHKKGFGFMRQTLMNGQDITLDLNRFKEVLLQALNSLAQ